MIGEIEQKIIERIELASQSGALGYRYAQVESMPIDADERVSELLVRLPAAWVAFGGWKRLRDHGDGSVEVEATWHVIVSAQNLRNEAATRLGAGPQEVGSYQMAMDAVQLLTTQDFGLDMGGLALGACRSLYTGALKDKRKISMFAVEFTSRLLIEISALAASPPGQPPGDFATWHANWDTPPSATVDGDPRRPGVQLPADDTAPFTDNVEIPTRES